MKIIIWGLLRVFIFANIIASILATTNGRLDIATNALAWAILCQLLGKDLEP